MTNNSFENKFHDAVDNFPIDNDFIENEGSTDDYDEVATDNVSTKPIECNGNNRDDADASKCFECKRIPSTTNITNIVRENVDRSTIIDKGSNNDYDEVATDNISTKPIEGNGNNRDGVDASKPSESKRIPSTTNITNIARENVDRSTIIDKGSNYDYDEVVADNVSTNPVENNGNNRDGVDTSKCSESKRVPSTINIVRKIIDSMIDNISEKTTDQTEDNLVRILSKNDISNDLSDDDSSSIDPEMYTVASNESTTSMNNALSLLHKLHLEKIDTNNKNDTLSTTDTKKNENIS